MYHVKHMIEVRAHDVHLVDVDHTGNMIMVSLSPYSLGLRLNAALGTQDSDAAVENAQRALNLNGEVNVTRSVNNVNTGITPVAGGGRRGDGYTSLLLLNHPVHGSSTLVSLTYLVVDTGVKQNTFGRSGFTGVNVSHDTDISGFLK